MVMVTGAAARCWKNAFHAFGSAIFFLGGEDPDTPHGLHNFGARWVRLRPTWYRLPPQAKNPSYAPEDDNLTAKFHLDAFNRFAGMHVSL